MRDLKDTDTVHMVRSCRTCTNLRVKAYGYSDYTVEGYTYSCKLGVFEHEDADDFQERAIECLTYYHGEGDHHNVECDCEECK